MRVKPSNCRCSYVHQEGAMAHWRVWYANAVRSPGVDTDLSNWSVNSIPGGNNTYGTISESLNSATFTAPSKAPEPNTVRVSVNAQATQWSWEGSASTEKTVLFSYITIGSAGTYKGTFTVKWRNGHSVDRQGRGDLDAAGSGE